MRRIICGIICAIAVMLSILPLGGCGALKGPEEGLHQYRQYKISESKPSIVRYAISGAVIGAIRGFDYSDTVMGVALGVLVWSYIHRVWKQRGVYNQGYRIPLN